MFLLNLNSFEFKDFYVRRLKGNEAIKKSGELLQSISFVASYFLFYKYRLINKFSSITELHIELVSYCNLRCIMCSLDHDKPKVRMSENILHTVLKNITTIPQFRSIKTLHLHNGGEALLHPKFMEMLGIIKMYKDEAEKNKKPFPKIALLTNATILTEEFSKRIVDADVVDHIRFSMDGGSKEKFEELRVRAKWEVFVKNIKDFCRLNKLAGNKIKTGIISLIEYSKSMNTKWMSEEFKDLLHTVDSYELRYAHNWGGEVEVAELKNKSPKGLKKGCSMLMHQLVVLPDGNVTVCCADLNSRGVIGNISKEPLISIYNKPQRLNMLQKFMQNKQQEIDLCKDCLTF